MPNSAQRAWYWPVHGLLSHHVNTASAHHILSNQGIACVALQTFSMRPISRLLLCVSDRHTGSYTHMNTVSHQQEVYHTATVESAVAACSNIAHKTFHQRIVPVADLVCCSFSRCKLPACRLAYRSCINIICCGFTGLDCFTFICTNICLSTDTFWVAATQEAAPTEKY